MAHIEQKSEPEGLPWHHLDAAQREAWTKAAERLVPVLVAMFSPRSPALTCSGPNAAWRAGDTPFGSIRRP